MATGDNVALLSLGATATADSSYEVNSYGPQFAIDGTDAQVNSPNNRWNGWPGGQDPVNEWLRVDLGSAKNITAFKLIQFGGPGSYKYATRVKIEASNDDATWVEKYRSSSDESTLINLKPLWRAGTHRYWKITCLATGGSANNGWGVHTFGLIEGDAGSGVNWARDNLGATATANSSGSVQNSPTNAIDGNNGTYVLADTGVAGTANVTVDLAGPRLVKSFRLQFVNSVWTPGQYKIESSNDGTVWASRYYRTSTAAMSGTDTGRINLYAGVTARYWRIRQLSAPAGTTGIGPTDFELWNDASGSDPGDDPEEDPAYGGWTLGSTNYALTSLGASATSNRTSYQGTVPNQAINGNDSDYVLLLEGTPRQNLVIDLGQARPICGWAVAWVNDSWYASAYTIEYSTDNSAWTPVHTATGETMTSGNANRAFSNGGGATARYWRITFTACPVEGAGPTTFKLIEGTPPSGGVTPPKPPKWINSFPYLTEGAPLAWAFEIPDEVQHGDLMVMTIATQPAVDLYSGHPTYGPPAGWTMLNASGQNAVHTIYKLWQIGDPRRFSVEFFGGILNGNHAVHIFRKFNTTTPLAGYSHTQYSTGSTPSSTAFDPTDWSGSGTALHVIAWITAGTRPRTMTGVPSGWKLLGGTGSTSPSLGQTQLTTKPLADKTSAPAVSATFNQAQEAHEVSWVIMPEQGSITHEGAASVSGAATQASNLVKATPATASVATSATVAADGVKQKPGTAECAAAATAEATGSLMLGGISDLNEATAEITEANGVVGIGGKANVDAIVVATMNGGYEKWGAATPTAAATAEADGKFGTVGEADLLAEATTNQPNGYMSASAAADRNAFAVVVGLASLHLNGEAAPEAVIDIEPVEGSVRKPGAASRFATASAFAFGGRMLGGSKTLVARADVAASGFTGPGGESAVTARATIDNAVSVLADVSATDPIDVPTARATVAPATPDLTLGGIADLEATAELGEIPGTIVFQGTSSRFGVASSTGFGGYLVELEGHAVASATVNQPDLIQATPGSSDIAVSATVSQPEGILEKWGVADLEATAETDLLNGLMVYGAATDLVAEATFPDTFGGLLQRGHISALAQVFRSARGGYLQPAAAAIQARATATCSALGLTAGNAHVVLEAHMLAFGESLNGGHSNVTARATATAGGGLTTRAAATCQARATVAATGQRRAGGRANVQATATISDFSGSILLGAASAQARATVDATPSRDRQAHSSVIARLTTSRPAARISRTASAAATAQIVMPPAVGIPGSSTEPAAPGATMGALGGIWHQGWCYPMAVSTAALGTTTVIRTARGSGVTGSGVKVGAIAWPRSGFATAEATAQLSGRLRKPSSAALAAAVTAAAEAIKYVRGAGQPQTARATVEASGVRERFGAASITARGTFRGFGGVQGRSDVVATATATGQAFMSRDNVEGAASPAQTGTTAEALGGIWHQGLCAPMAVSTVAAAQPSMIWGARALPELRAAVAAALARVREAQADNRAEAKYRANSRVARTGGGSADVQATTAANGVGLVEAGPVHLTASVVDTAEPVRVRSGRANVTGRLTLAKRLAGVIVEAAGDTATSVTITREGSLVRRRGAASGAAAATVSAVGVVAPRGASFLVARATTSRPRAGYLRVGRGNAVWRVAATLGAARVERPSDGEAVATATTTASLVRTEQAGVDTAATASVQALGGVLRQSRAALMAGAIVTGTARRDVADGVTLAARATLAGRAFRRLLAEAAGHVQVTLNARGGDSLAGSVHAQVTLNGNAGRLLRSGPQQLQARTRSLAFAIYEGESAIVLHVTAAARGAREQATGGSAEVGATVQARAGLRHVASGDLVAFVATSEPLSVNSRLGAATALLGASAGGFLGRLQSRTGTAPAQAAITRAVLARTQAATASLLAEGRAAGRLGRQVEVEAQALAEVRVTGSEGQELIGQGACSVSAGAAGTVGRVQAGRGQVLAARATVTGSIRREKIAEAAATARVQFSARAGLAVEASGELVQTAEATGDLALTMSEFAGASGSAEASASGGLLKIGSAQVIGRATRTAKLARVLPAAASVYARASVRRPVAGTEMAGQAVVMVGALAEGNSGNEIQGAAEVSAEIAGLALAGVTLQASAATFARGTIRAYEAGTMKAAAGVLLARAYSLAHIAGQVPALAEVVARATVTAAGAASAPWWGQTTVGTKKTTTGGVVNRGPFG